MLLPFQKVFMADQTSVSVPLKDDFKEQQKKNIVTKQEHILSKVTHYIENNLDPRK